MNLTTEQKQFRDSLDRNRQYKVEGRNYTHVTPDAMSAADIKQLMEKFDQNVDINEDSILYTGQLIL